MNSTGNISTLKGLTSELINNALNEIKRERQNSLSYMEGRFRTAEYLLLEAKEYIDGAWEMLEHNKCRASLALSRWLLEASIYLLWVLDGKDEIEQRLKDITGEALRNDANLCEGLAELCPKEASALKSQAQKARTAITTLGARKLERSLEKMVKNIKEPNTNWPRLYVLYRICCAAAHPALKFWERFASAGNATISSVPTSPIDNRRIACWMTAASTLYLVFGAYCLTKLGKIEDLDNWWKKQVSPLLDV